MDKICDPEPRTLPLLEEQVPKQIVEIICRCLHFDRKHRYEKAGDLLEHMKDVFEVIENESKQQDEASQSQTSQAAGSAPEAVKPIKNWNKEEVYLMLREVCG